MKLRLRKNSIRLRLLQSEIERLRTERSISETIQFAPLQFLTYKLEVSDSAKDVSARFENGEIIVAISPEQAFEWTETNLVGLENELKIDEDLTLKITIEKDFVCTNRLFDADNRDAFSHPKTNC